MEWSQIKALLLCLLMVTASFAQTQEDNTYYFNAEVTR